jgi:DNA-binding CsgD family transcriptional regulator
VTWRVVAARAQRALGDLDAARALAAEQLGLGRDFGAARPLGEALLLSAELADAPIPLLEEAVEVLEASSARLVRARALIGLGAALRRANRRADAREPLAAGRELADALGAPNVAEHARQELLAAGARPRKIVRSGIDALTASELRTARLAAAGATNREIAAELFVTVKTVEDHLGAAYRKLGIRGRRELAAKVPG